MIRAELIFFETVEEYCRFMREMLDPCGDNRIVHVSSKPVDTCAFLNYCVAYAEPYEGKYGAGYKVVINRNRFTRCPRGCKPKNSRVLYVTDGYYFGPVNTDEDDRGWFKFENEKLRFVLSPHQRWTYAYNKQSGV